MPQSPTPNMALVKPTENGDTGVWASLLDAMFDLIDTHDHSTGKGVKVSMVNGVNVAADIPWSSGGTFYAITSLKAIDFQPRPQSEMSAFAGALFVDSANNELSYRTTGGSIIRFTNGATFNFSAIGAIGGDYSSVGALVDFVDANDLYRFRQQIGGGVQQYARLDCGGVDLFEFKAHPAAGVPGNRVRLSSPAALAASYEMTWPGALPAAANSRLLGVDSAGQVSLTPSALPSAKATLVMDASGVTTTTPISPVYPATMFVPTTGGGAGFGSSSLAGAFVFPTLSVGTTGGGGTGPLVLNLGATITSWSTAWSKISGVTGTISAMLVDCTPGGGVSTIGAVQTNSANAPGSVTLGQSGLSTVVASGHSYVVVVWGNANTGGDTCNNYTALAL